MKLWISLTLALLPLSSLADMYRCGNVYQDRSCDAGVPQQTVKSWGGTTPAAPVNGVASPLPVGAPAAKQAKGDKQVCAQVAERAQQIAWKREAGATRESQVAEIRGQQANFEAEALIKAVYSRSGSANDIRVAVEAECMVRGSVGGAFMAGLAKPKGDFAECESRREKLRQLEERIQAGGRGMSVEVLEPFRREMQDKLADARC